MLLWADKSETTRLDCCMLAKKADMFSQIFKAKGQASLPSPQHSALTSILQCASVQRQDGEN